MRFQYRACYRPQAAWQWITRAWTSEFQPLPMISGWRELPLDRGAPSASMKKAVNAETCRSCNLRNSTTCVTESLAAARGNVIDRAFDRTESLRTCRTSKGLQTSFCLRKTCQVKSWQKPESFRQCSERRSGSEGYLSWTELRVKAIIPCVSRATSHPARYRAHPKSCPEP